MIEFSPLSPVFLSIGPLKFHYYGLMYALGFSVAYLLLPYLYKIRGLKINKIIHENIFMTLALGGIIGGRIFYVLFYNFDYFLNYPLKVFAVWEGGMASHGGFIGAIIAVYLACNFYKINFLRYTDCVVIPVGIGLMLGRVGNLINGELYGRITDVSWCVNFEKAEGCRHPSQIYSIIKDLSIFIIMYNLRKTKYLDGSLFFIFFYLYLSMRFVVEFFREPDLQIGLLSLGLSQGQWISLIMIIIMSLLHLSIRQKQK